MCELNQPETAYAVAAIAVQAIMCLHFAVRRRRLEVAVRYGALVYALGVPLAALSLWLATSGLQVSFWLGGLLYLVWAAFGYAIEYVLGIRDWRAPIRWPVFGPYVLLYLATMMFYWWPLALICKPLWYVAAALFVAGTGLNVASHGGPNRVAD